MGLTYVRVVLKPYQGGRRSYSGRFLVDTGATDALAPGKRLRAMGVRIEGTDSYELADGTLHNLPFGLVRIEFEGTVTAGRVVFGPDDAEPILGVTALESAGFTVDPKRQRLKRMPAIPLKRARSRPQMSASGKMRLPRSSQPHPLQFRPQG